MLKHRETGTGRPLVLLHAFPLHSGMWDDVVEPLARDHRVITVDLPGFGGSHRLPEEPSLVTSANAVLDLADELGLDRFVLGGLSMGGYVAMRLLATGGDRVDAVILADTKAAADAPAARANRERIAAAVESGDRDVLFRDVLPTLIAPDASAHVRERVRALIAEAAPAAVAWAQRAMAVRPDSTAVLREVAVPALVLRGSEDGLATEADAAALVDALRRSHFVQVPGSGHLTAIERPTEFASAVKEFLHSAV